MQPSPSAPSTDEILLGDNLDLLSGFADEAFQLDLHRPAVQHRQGAGAQDAADASATRTATGRASAAALPDRAARAASYRDASTTTSAFLEPRLEEARRLLASDGTLYFHIDYREAHYCKVLLDEIFGRECFLNEIIWAYDYGARAKRRWPAKHDTILVYVKDPARYYFDSDAVDREPYMAPGLVTAEKAARGQAADRRVVAHDRADERPREDRLPDAEAGGHRAAHRPGVHAPGRLVLDFFAGSGTLGAVAAKLGRRYVLIDSNPEAVAVMRVRLG